VQAARRALPHVTAMAVTTLVPERDPAGRARRAALEVVRGTLAGH
jgi:hypothetical protein